MIGETIGNFEVVARLGQGGMGEVWLAQQKSVKTRVAIKILHAEISKEQTHIQRFFNEAVAVGKIRHAGITKIFDVGFHTDGQAYLVMEFLEGETLAVRIRRKGRIRIDQVIDIGRQIAGVLDATHAAGVTHRDLKPDNIFLIPDAELPSGERVKVLDFGIAKLGGTVGVTSSVTAMGTPLYMSPEQWKNPSKADSRSDVYSLGCVMFEMACGRPPFLASTLGEACTKHMSQPPPVPHTLVPDLPVGFDDLVLRLLKKKPTSRPTIKEITEALATIGDGPARVSSSSPPDTTTAMSRESADAHATTIPTGSGHLLSQSSTPRSSRLIPIAAGGVVVAGGIAAIVATRGSNVSSDIPTPVGLQAADAAPAPADADGPKPLLVSVKSLTRISGNIPQPRINVPITFCIDTAGMVVSVQIADDVATDVADEVRSKVMGWRHQPYKRANKVTPVCSMTMIAAKLPARVPSPPNPTTAEPKSGVVDSGTPPCDTAACRVNPSMACCPRPLPLPTAPTLAAAPDAAAIAAGIVKVRGQIQDCGDRNDASGTIAIKFTIEPSGRVSAVKVQHPKHALVECLTQAISRALFAKTQHGGTVDYPITFH